MKDLVLYIHGKGGSAAESAHYAPLFPQRTVLGLEYRAFTPREAGAEIRAAAETLKAEHGGILLIANSIGAFFSMHAGIGELLEGAFFISPIVDMEALIADALRRANVTEAELRDRGVVRCGPGEELSWEYLCYVRAHPLVWEVPTRILYGARDALTPYETIRAFARRHGAALTVMEDGEHWFHTEEQMRFLDAWITGARTERSKEWNTETRSY